ncbi:hypothetical protein P2Q00_49840 [Streptomyces coacervatus]|uniref:hypothetical protein n=1 Tax=Streptomyces coacervatus TaxID=647381 RepID=UPI0023D9AFFD|nr:hypothetical protein [Streptomyces coacervatus]MDF2273435.1 hypothetical protein [Streptomyces coacervatus]
MDDPYGDLLGRWMFAVWRLIARGVTAASLSRDASESRMWAGRAGDSVPFDPEMR